MYIQSVRPTRILLQVQPHVDCYRRTSGSQLWGIYRLREDVKKILHHRSGRVTWSTELEGYTVDQTGRITLATKLGELLCRSNWEDYVSDRTWRIILSTKLDRLHSHSNWTGYIVGGTSKITFSTKMDRLHCRRNWEDYIIQRTRLLGRLHSRWLSEKKQTCFMLTRDSLGTRPLGNSTTAF